MTNYVIQMSDKCGYMFMRSFDGIDRELLQLVEDKFNWTNDIDSAVGYFPGPGITSYIFGEIMEEININRANGFHVTIIEVDLDYNGEAAKEPKQYILLPLGNK